MILLKTLWKKREKFNWFFKKTPIFDSMLKIIILLLLNSLGNNINTKKLQRKSTSTYEKRLYVIYCYHSLSSSSPSTWITFLLNNLHVISLFLQCWSWKNWSFYCSGPLNTTYKWSWFCGYIWISSWTEKWKNVYGTKPGKTIQNSKQCQL